MNVTGCDSSDSSKTWYPGMCEPGLHHELTMVPERIFTHIISPVGESDDSSMNNAKNISRTEFDSHVNMVVLGINTYILNDSGRKEILQPYS